MHALCTTMRTLIFLALSLSLSSSFLPANMPPQLSTLNVTQCRLSAPPHITTRTRSFQEEHIGMHSEASNLSLLVSSGRRFTPEVFLFPKMGFNPCISPQFRSRCGVPEPPLQCNRPSRMHVLGCGFTCHIDISAGRRSRRYPSNAALQGPVLHEFNFCMWFASTHMSPRRQKLRSYLTRCPWLFAVLHWLFWAMMTSCTVLPCRE